MNNKSVYDLIVIGGGINGCGIALDAAGRGLSVALFEEEDLACATSSASSKLLHGGLRYLEQFEFRMVRDALNERETILKIAPHIVTPLRFRLPHRDHLRPSWMIRAGLFLYDHMAKRTTLTGSRTIRFGHDSPLKPGIRKGYEYSDGWMDDSRLVVVNACLAREKGARVHTRMPVIQACRKKGVWQVTVRDKLDGKEKIFQGHALVNVTGPWVEKLFDIFPQQTAPRSIRLVKGSHIIIPAIHHGEEAYILQNEDKRIVFVIPYFEKFSLVGTTDIDYEDDPRQAVCSEKEMDYLIKIVNAHFTRQTVKSDVISSYSGVRPLLLEEGKLAQEASRDYILELSDSHGKAPLLSVFGGKLTTYRKLAEDAINRLRPYFSGSLNEWTAEATLPGGHIVSVSHFKGELMKKYPWMSARMAQRLASTHGSNSYLFLQDAKSIDDLGEHFGEGFTEKELDYLITEEWAMTLEDVIKRRTKLYLFLDREQTSRLDTVINEKVRKHCRQRMAG